MPEDKGLTRSQREEKILQFWKENKIFEKTLEKKSPKGDFIFYEGPPTANAKPALHHMEARFFKDAIPRYKTMRGYHVPRRAGWDTHGLPVELQIEKKLGFKSKKDIEAYGIEKFNKECKESVFEYIADWEKFTERIGYWINFKDAYYTFENSYIESVWKIIAHANERGLLYKDYKVVPWCPRCGTALSSHELAQGYQDVKDLSLYVKFKINGFPDAYFLAWTTTPWTLPGNLALAVGEDITYVEAKVGKEILVLAKDRLSIITEPYEIIAEHKGKEMVGMSYEPLYPFLKEKGEKTFKIYTADFVTTEDGTGIVHTAVMYGQEDFDLGTKIGLPKHHLVGEDGSFKEETDFLAGKSVTEESTAVEILKDLQNRGLLFAKENYAHSYPFCWRCGTRLIYYARDSWYIAMSKLRHELTKENERIHWEPAHIKEGRFGEWLREAKDWAISRERYWGTPLPVWESGGERLVIDSTETLKKYIKPSTNNYFVMRHGEAENNVLGVLNCDPKTKRHLTPKGKEVVSKSAHNLKDKKITKIFCSQLARACETAAIVKEVLGSHIEVVEDSRLNETGFGTLEGKAISEYVSNYPKEKRFENAPEEGETLSQLRRRMGEFLYDLETKFKNETILVISHGDPIWMMQGLSGGLSKAEIMKEVMSFYPDTGEVNKLEFVPLPHNEDYELDLHKPFIDGVVLFKDGKEFKRSKEVMDVWLDSGSMPFAQDPKNVLFPADFISEAIDQTRGWFYTLHAVGILMGEGHAFENVICLGHILDKDGKKMSKSVGNVVEPFQAIERHGVDTLRLWMYSVNQPGESKNFDERTVEEVSKRFFNLLDNVYAFYELYRERSIEGSKGPDSKNILDKWIMVRLNQLTSLMTEKIDAYELMAPTRALREFIDDLSTWYLRRSRERIKSGDQDSRKTLYFVLKELSKLLAPFAPFAAEELYQKLRVLDDPESVHLEKWPEEKKNILDFGRSEKILHDMAEARRLVSLALEARSRASIKIRQPLSKLEIKDLDLSHEYVGLIKDEVNVKKVQSEPRLETLLRLDTALTPELIEEGEIREEIRSIQEIRKDKRLLPGEKMSYTPPPEKKEFYLKHGQTISGATNTTIVNN